MKRTYLLDTCACLFAVADGLESLGKAARRIMIREENELVLSSVSIVEMGILRSLGKIRMDFQAVQQSLSSLRASIVPYRAQHAAQYFDLPWFSEHRDPFDRMIIATALAERFPVITSDPKFLGYNKLEVVW